MYSQSAYCCELEFSERCVLTVTGQKIFAHKAIICARCDVMAAMFGGHFVEGSNSTSDVRYSLHCYKF